MRSLSVFDAVGLPPEREGYAASDDLRERRAGMTAALAAGYWLTDPAGRQEEIGGVRCLRFASPEQPRATVLHMHGGAFRIGCPEQIGPFASALAKRCHVDVICPAYRLAPEHPFPAGLGDGWSVLKALATSGEGRIMLSGDSAGGGLAAGLAALCHEAGIKLAGLALLSPWLDLTASNPSYAENAAHDPLFSLEAAQIAAQLYLQGTPAADPLASPLRGNVSGFPPTFINVGTGEVLRDDARLMHDHLQRSGVAVCLQDVEAMEHVAVTRGLSLPGSAATLDAIAQFIERILIPAE